MFNKQFDVYHVFIVSELLNFIIFFCFIHPSSDPDSYSRSECSSATWDTCSFPQSMPRLFHCQPQTLHLGPKGI